MNKILVAIFLICNCFSSNAVFLQRSSESRFSTLSQLRNIQESDFGKRILDTIALQMTNDSPLSDVSKMLADILANLKAQQVTDDGLINKGRIDCKEEQEKFTNNRDVCQKNANEAEEQIGVLKSEIETIEKKIKVLSRQQKILASREKAIHISREADRRAYTKRQEQGPSVIKALGLIIEKLGTIKPTSVDKAFVELANIGKENPIAALLQVASTFSKKTLVSCIKKMAELKSSIEAALSADEEAEQQAEAQYKKMVAEIHSTKKNVATALSEQKGTLENKNTALTLQEKKLEENTKCASENDKKLRQKIKACNEMKAKYKSDKESRAKEMNIIVQVQKILVRNKESMKSFLQRN